MSCQTRGTRLLPIFRLAVIAFLLVAVSTIPSLALTGQEARLRLLDAGWEPAHADGIVDRVERSTGRVVAVFDHDNTLICGDITEGNGKSQPGFMRSLLLARKDAGTLPPEVPPEAFDDPWEFYHAWARREPQVAYGWICTLLAGQTPAEARQAAEEYYACHVKPAIYPEMRELVEVLKDLGVEVWVVSASAEPVVRSAARFFGLPEDHVLGVRLAEENGRILPRVIPPISFAAGKTWYIKQFVGEFPPGNILVFGDSYRTDGHMLRFGAAQGGFSLLVNPAPDLIPTLETHGIRSQPLASKAALDR